MAILLNLVKLEWFVIIVLGYKNYSLICYLIFIFKRVKAFSIPYAKTLMSLLYSVSSLH